MVQAEEEARKEDAAIQAAPITLGAVDVSDLIQRYKLVECVKVLTIREVTPNGLRLGGDKRQVAEKTSRIPRQRLGKMRSWATLSV